MRHATPSANPSRQCRRLARVATAPPGRLVGVNADDICKESDITLW